MRAADPIVLYTPYFAARTAERQRELDGCLRLNYESAVFARIVLLVDDGHQPPFTAEGIEVRAIPTRPTYRQWVDYSIAEHPTAISVLANSDIYFDESLTALRDLVADSDIFVALSRYEKHGEILAPHPNPHWSQDTWVFHTASKPAPSLLRALDIPLGVPRCDNKIAYLFAIHGWRVFNPQQFIRSVHLHETQQRNYDKQADLTVIGSVAYVHPGDSLATAATIDIDVWAKGAGAIRKITLNKSLDRWSAAPAPNSEPSPAPNSAPNSAPNPAPCLASPAPTPHGLAPLVHPIPSVTVATLAEAPALSVIREFIGSGTPVYDHLRRFRILRLGDRLLYLDGLRLRGPLLRSLAPGTRDPSIPLRAEDLGVFIPPTIDSAPVIVWDRPVSPADCHFWQYPCTTEKQAFDNHRVIPGGANIDAANRVVHTYLGLPWATYIDKGQFPPEVLAYLGPRLMGFRSLAVANGYGLAVHTVCQQIYWRRLTHQFRDLGITDLHISHCEQSIDREREDCGIRIHSWPLIAPNIENPTRTMGLTIGRPAPERRYLASFIGAHMKHYRSDVRMRLLETAKRDGGSDVLFDLGGEWHFNKIVYTDQVGIRPLRLSDSEEQEAQIRRYNEVLSDSVFSLCPEGAGPNTLRIWESLATGAIPVIVADDWVPPTIPGSPLSLTDCCVFVPCCEIDGIFTLLRSIGPERIAKLQKRCIRVYPLFRAMTTF